MSTVPTLAIDPGITTGLAVRSGSDIVTSAVRQTHEVYELVTSSSVDLVVIEDFNTAGRISAPGLHTVRLVGGVRALCWYLRKPCVVQTPTTRRLRMDEAKKWAKGKGLTVHEIDAVAHLLTWEFLSTQRASP